MKKIFSFMLMAMLCTVMAWAADVHVSTFAELKSAVESGSATTIYLDKDIEYRATANNTCVNIARSLTIDGQGHTLTGYAGRNNSTNGTLIALNHASTPNTYSIDVTIKNFNIIDEKFRAIETRSNVGSLTLENCYIEATGKGSYQQPLTIGGNQSSAADVNIINSEIVAKIYYPIITFNPVNLTITDSRIDGWCSVYFKGPDGSAGAHGSTVVATNSYFNAQNYNSGHTNTFGAFVLEDDYIDITLDNCVVDVTAHDGTGVATQALFLLSDWAEDPADYSHMTIKGSNSHVIGDFILVDWDATVPVQLELQGGSYYGTDFEKALAVVREDESHPVAVATGYHAEALSQGGADMYRIIKDVEKDGSGDPLYDLNDNVEDEGKGENPVTSFELSVGDTMKLDENRKVTTAGYVQVKDNEDSGKGTVVKVGTTDNEDKKVDQTLVINNGLDVQGNSKVEVQSGSTLQIGEGGIVTGSSENIVIEADEQGAGSLLLDPTITVNQTPNLTVKMLAKQIGRDASGDFFWHRFAMPVLHIENWDKEGTLEGKGSYVVTYPTYVYAWDYDENDWKNIAPKAMIPLKGYTLTLASDYIHVDGDGKVVSEDADGGNLYVRQDVYYTFKGNLVGNTDQALKFEKEGFNFFGNSYTGYMDALTVINGIESEHVDNTIYMWNSAEQTYSAVSKFKLESVTQRKRLADWQKEIAPMQTFILRLRGADDANESVSYADAIWGNPRYGNPAPAPARLASVDQEDAYLEIKVTAANGKSDKVDFTEMASKSDAFESAYDAEKYMNRNSLNLYADVEGINLSSVVTDDLIGKTLSMQTVNEVNYTMTFANVEGNEYALLDKATNEVIAITNDAVYTFTAQPNSTVENRFEIVAIAKAPTAVENTESSVKARGIYTMLGQYMGEDLTVLPAGVYVVNGVKIVK